MEPSPSLYIVEMHTAFILKIKKYPSRKTAKLLQFTEQLGWQQVSATKKKNSNLKDYTYWSLLVCNQPLWDKVARTTASKRLHPISISTRWSSVRRKDHIWIQYKALWTTCKKWEAPTLLKTISFLQIQIAQTKAQAPMRIRAFVFLSTPVSQFVNKLSILVGGEILKVKWISLQIFLVKERSDRK